MGQPLSTARGYSASIFSNNNNNNINSNNANGMNNNVHPVGHEPYSKRKRNKPRKDLSDNELQQLTKDVLDLLHVWFPEMHQRTYFMPPVHMNKVKHTCSTVGGAAVQKVEKTPESDWRDDEVMQRTLLCLRALFDRRTVTEPMVVLLQMQHDNYLNKPCYAKAAARFNRPLDLDPKLRRGDFDLLFLHRQHGIVVAEIKSVGWRPGETQDDSIVRKKVKQAVDQLNKAKTVLKHLVQDLSPSPRVTKTLILPNVASHRLRALLQQDQELATEFCNCFDTPDIDSALGFCLFADQMTSHEKPADVTNDMLVELEKWWQHVASRAGYTSHTCADLGAEKDEEEEVYELLVARFCGPASTVQVHCVKTPRLEFRTLGHAVHEVGERMVEFVLFPEQLALLEEEEALVYLTGPPGTGKTLLLVLVALQWCKEGHDVHIVSTGTFSEAATQQLYYQVIKTLESDADATSRIHLHLNGNSSKNLPAIISKLIAASGAGEGSQLGQGSTVQGGQLFVVADEIGEDLRKLFQEVKNNVADLHLWAASYRREYRPEEMTERAVRACLRCTPTVRRRMETAVSFSADDNVYAFEDKRAEYLAATEGPTEMFLSHADHPAGPAMECVHCGQQVADFLHTALGLGQTASKPKAKGVKTPPPLKYSDVMIIPDFYQNIGNLRDDVTDDVTGQIHPATGIVQGLRSRDVPTYVVTRNDAESIRDLACATRDAVAVVEWGVGNGLERKVVVSVGEGRESTSGVSGVLHGASRCVSQLIYVKCSQE